MLGQRTARSLAVAPILSVAVLSLACSQSAEDKKSPELQTRAGSSNSSASASPLVAQAMPTSTMSDQSVALPKSEEVREALARVFDKAVAVDEQHAPAFVIGDFNGDGSEDLAIVGRAAGNSLAEINSELANWTLEDPTAVPIPGTKAAERTLPPNPVRAEKTDVLLAIIHGVGAQGWRNREARQTYLLKNGAGSNITVQPLKKLRDSAGKNHLPPLRGDAISEMLGGKSGILFWTGAKYAWFSPAK
jgi:hypothetical protein